MFPSFAATAMFYYEWTKHGPETILLAFAIICLMMGVIFGSLIVWSASGSGDKPTENEESTENSPLPGTDAQARIATLALEKQLQVEQLHIVPTSAAKQTNFEVAEVQEEKPTLDPLTANQLQIALEEVPATNSALSKLFEQLSDTVASAIRKDEEQACPSDRWNEPVKSESRDAIQETRTVEELLTHADVLIAQENYDEALKLYDSVVKLDPNNFDAWFLKAVALRRKHRSQDAIYCVNFALSIKRASVVAMVEKGECLLQLDRADQAIVWFDKALSQDKIAIAPWIGKARGLLKLGETNSAIACYEKVLSLQPDHAEAKIARAELASKLNGQKKPKAVG